MNSKTDSTVLKFKIIIQYQRTRCIIMYDLYFIVLYFIKTLYPFKGR
jgi:hypothetical protein